MVPFGLELHWDFAIFYMVSKLLRKALWSMMSVKVLHCDGNEWKTLSPTLLANLKLNFEGRMRINRKGYFR